MKPGDLVTIRRMNLSHRAPITYIDVYDRFDDISVPYKKKWEHGEVGVLLEGRVGWVDEEMLRVIDESR